MIDVQNLSRTYPGKVPVLALRDATFQIEEGEFIALMGRSGSGKSTLLHQLGLLDTPTTGKIFIDGEDVLSLSDHEKAHFRLEKLGYIFQEFAILTEFTALDNVCIPIMAMHDRPNGNPRDIAAEMLRLVGLGHRLDHYPSELSGGEQQRVVIARALVNKPKLLLADEPTANLDSDTAASVLELLARLNRELKQTIIMISHEEEDARWVNRIIRMKDGRIEKISKANGRGRKK